MRAFVEGVYGGELHAKRIASLAGATLGVMHAASLAVALIGQALAQVLSDGAACKVPDYIRDAIVHACQAVPTQP